jgi:acyl-CoA thioester hydrolase
MTAAIVDHGHVEQLDVHFDDLDAMGIVHNARYAVLVERAMSAYWARRGFSYAGGAATQSDVFLAVAEFAINFRVPVRGTGTIGVHFWVDRLGSSSATYGFRVLSADGAVTHAEGRRVVIKLDPVTLRPAPWSPEGREIATALMVSG